MGVDSAMVTGASGPCEWNNAPKIWKPLGKCYLSNLVVLISISSYDSYIPRQLLECLGVRIFSSSIAVSFFGLYYFYNCILIFVPFLYVVQHLFYYIFYYSSTLTSYSSNWNYMNYCGLHLLNENLILAQNNSVLWLNFCLKVINYFLSGLESMCDKLSYMTTEIS